MKPKKNTKAIVRPRRQKQPKLDAAFCRHLLMVVGDKDSPSAGTLGAVMYKLKLFNKKAAAGTTARKLVEYLDRPEYRHHLSPAILTSLERIKAGGVKNTLYSAQLSPKIAKQLQLLHDVGLTSGGYYLTPLGIQLFKDWPALRATLSRRIQHTFARAKYAEQRAAVEYKRVQTLQHVIIEKERELWRLRNP